MDHFVVRQSNAPSCQAPITIEDIPAPPLNAEVIQLTPTSVTLKMMIKLDPPSDDILRLWDCTEALDTDLTARPIAYSDGSHQTADGAATVIAHPQWDHTLIVAERSSGGNSFAPEVQAAALGVEFEPIQNIIVLIDNESAVKTAKAIQENTLKPLTSLEQTHLIGRLQVTLRRKPEASVVWIKGHARIPGNVVADTFAKWATHLPFPPRPPAPRFSIWQGPTPIQGKIPRAIMNKLIPQHKHLNIDAGLSFLWYRKASPFSVFQWKWVNGLTAVDGFEVFSNLRIAKCSSCDGDHCHDPLSSIAFCPAYSEHRNALLDLWPSSCSRQIQDWMAEAPPQDQRLFIRNLIPTSLAALLRGLALALPNTNATDLVVLRNLDLDKTCLKILSKLHDSPPRHGGTSGPNAWRASVAVPLVSPRYVPPRGTLEDLVNAEPAAPRPKKRKRK
jgi:ribonuclease HI